MYNLLIVESPTKAKKLWGLLKNIKNIGSWQVTASVGHMIDLPDDDTGVFPEQGFTAMFMVDPDKRSLLADIIKEAEKADAVYLGADPDREGEAIAWHVWNLLRKRFPNKVFHRVRYNAITKSEIKNAIENPETIDLNLVEAQIARRLLDRLVGYTFTPAIQDAVKGWFSVGRVQAVALARIVERERERRFHQPVDLYHVTARLEDAGGESIELSTEKTEDRSASSQLRSSLQSPHGYRIETETKRQEIKPPPPFVTSSLLQELCGALGVQSDKIMKAAQTLFQNGHITYHRTDSTRISPQRASGLRSYVETTYPGKQSKRIRMYGKGGAHEAILVTHPENVPSSMTGNKDVKAVYEALWRRSLATQMSPVVVDRTAFKVMVKGKAVITYYGDTVIEDGWGQVVSRKSKPVFIPVKISSAWGVKTESEPPKRYSDSSVIKMLKDCGVGRPSTYASILSTLRRHKYISGKGFLQATIRGEMLYYFLTKWIPDLVDSKFTSSMEEGLDLISSGRDSVACALSELRKYWGWIQETLAPFNDPKSAITLRPFMSCGHCGTYAGPLVFPFFGNPYFLCKGCGQYSGVDFDPESGELTPFKERPFYGACTKCGEKKLQLLQSKYGFWVKCQDCGAKNFL